MDMLCWTKSVSAFPETRLCLTLTLVLWLPNLCYSRLCSLRGTEQGTPLGDHSPLGAPGTPHASPTKAAASTSKEKEEPWELQCLHLQLRKPWSQGKPDMIDLHSSAS